MSPVAVAAGLVVVALVVFAAACAVFWAHRRAPKYLVTLQKVSDKQNMPETVTIQANLPQRSTVTELWKQIERMGLAATSRMQSINQDILDAMVEESNEISRKRAEKDREKAAHEQEKRKTRLARQLGKPVDEITDAMLATAQRASAKEDAS